MRRLIRAVSLSALCASSCFAQDGHFDFGGHTKYRLTSTSFPEDSLFRELAGSHADDLGFVARLKLEWDRRGFDLRTDAQVAALYGDAVEYTRNLPDELTALFPRLPTDDRRLFDLTHVVTDQGKRAALVRLDRLAAGFTSERTVVRFGRQAITWGNGLMFNTVMDIFNPFDPTTVDKEYKSGDDMLYAQYLRANGDDLQGVVVVRRNPLTGNVESDQSSVALKHHGFVGAGELDALLGRHFGETIAAVGGNHPIGGALWRGDLAATWTDTGGTVVSAVTSLSQSFTLRGKNVSGVVEYYYNGFGQPAGQYAPAELAENGELLARLSRGELYNLGRHYLGISALIEATPLFVLTPSLFWNVGDPSALLQIATRNDISQNMTLLGALNVPIAGAGTEFGGIDTGTDGVQLSTGPGVFVQLAWYF